MSIEYVQLILTGIKKFLELQSEVDLHTQSFKKSQNYVVNSLNKIKYSNIYIDDLDLWDIIETSNESI